MINSFEARFGDKESEIPAVRFVVDMISRENFISNVKIRSWAGTEFLADLTIDQVKRVAHHPAVVSIKETKSGLSDVVLSSAHAYGDVFSGSEIIPWWKISTNTNDSRVFTMHSPKIRVIEGPMGHPVSFDVYLQENNNSTPPLPWSWLTLPEDPWNPWPFWHAVHVNGVIGAKLNGSLLRGINPGQPIIHYGTLFGYQEFIDVLNDIIYRSEILNEWGAINLSINNPLERDYHSNDFDFSGIWGRPLAIATNSNIVFQSAGNNESAEACKFGYTFAGQHLEWDSILLVGGHDINFQPSSENIVTFNDTVRQVRVKGTNSGPCVEVWAPSRQITSLRYKTELTQVLSGTSFAAPIAASVAIRFGSNHTRPLEREWFIKKNTHSPGHPMVKAVRWTPTGDKINRHNVYNFWSPQNSSNLHVLKDYDYHNAWTTGYNASRVVIDLGVQRNVKFIRVTPRSSVPVSQNKAFHFSVAPANDAHGYSPGSYQYYSISKHGDRAPITIPLNDINSRYLILNGHNTGSPLSFSEIEVYGY